MLEHTSPEDAPGSQNAKMFNAAKSEPLMHPKNAN